MEIREMKYIKAISEANNMTQAAENLYISQPALSKTVKRIEYKLGFKLFKKVGTRNVLTEKGKRLVENIEPVLDAYTQFEDALSNDIDTQSCINYGVIPYYCTPFTTMFLYEFKNRFPDIKVNMIEAPPAILSQKLLKGEIDIAMTETILSSEDIAIYSGFKDDVSVAIGYKNNYYTAKKVSFEDLKDQTFNIVTSSAILNQQIVEGCHRAGYNPKIGYQSSQISLLLHKTNVEDSICILNRPMIYDNIVADAIFEKVHIIPLDPPPLCFCYISIKKKNQRSKALDTFLTHITEALTVDTKERII